MGRVGHYLDRFTALRIGSGLRPMGEEYGSSRRQIMPGTAIQEFLPDHYPAAVAIFFSTLACSSTTTATSMRSVKVITAGNEIVLQISGRFCGHRRLELSFSLCFHTDWRERAMSPLKESDMKTKLSVFLTMLILILLNKPGSAAELIVLGGYTGSDHPEEDTYAWQIEYLKDINDHLAFSISYINQGHFQNHHRDADALSLWYRNLFGTDFLLGVGGGLLFYYDTIDPDDAPAQDSHGWGTILSASANWYIYHPWFIQMQGDFINADQSFDTVSVFLGIGYQFDATAQDRPSNEDKPTKNEITLFGGQSIVNITGAGSTTAAALEYRRTLLGYLEWTLGGLYEGKSDLTNRYGLTSQLWLKESFYNERISLGAGFGGYFATDQQRHDDEGILSGIFSMTGGFRFTNHWSLRAVWDRILTHYDRDSDVIMAGVSYHF